MPRAERAPSFQFYPQDFWSDPAVRGLSMAEVGAYLHILSMSFLSDNPGVIAVADLPRLSTFGRGWPRHEAALSRCFDISQPGVWIQKRMRDDRKLQRLRHEASIAGARKTNEIKADRYAQRTSEVRIAVGPSSSSSSSSSVEDSGAAMQRAHAPADAGVENSEPNPAMTLVRGLAGKLEGFPQPPSFPADQAWRWVTAELKPRDPRAAMQFMAWSWKHVCRDLEAIQGMVLEWRDKRIVNPRAYFSANGAGACRADSATMQRNEREQAEIKANERAWLAGRQA